MSFWAKAGVQIKDLDAFFRVCEKHDIECKNVNETMYHLYNRKAQKYNRAYIENEGEHWTLHSDNDINYNSFNFNLGKDAALLMRDYAQEVVLQNVVAANGYVIQSEEETDGSLLLRVAI
jgi:hypothetical protein